MKEQASKIDPIDVILINVGSNSNEKNGISPIFGDGRFEYWPIEENRPGQQTPRFRDLKIHCKYPDLYAHFDPCFESTPTYGDIRDVPAMRALNEAIRLNRKPILLFASTLKYQRDSSRREAWILEGVGYYVIGFFLVTEVRFALNSGIMNWKGHRHNAHYRRPNHDKGIIKLLIAGGRRSRLLTKPYPIAARPNSGLEPNSWLRRNFRELRGGPIAGGPWYRRTFRNAPATNSDSVLKEFAEHEE
jgi:Nucleotide modification associated domain 3